MTIERERKGLRNFCKKLTYSRTFERCDGENFGDVVKVSSKGGSSSGSINNKQDIDSIKNYEYVVYVLLV